MNLVRFNAGTVGAWRIDAITAVAGETLRAASHLDVANGDALQVHSASTNQVWKLAGLASNIRYAVRTEVDALRSRQEGLGRSNAVCAALIPIRKSAAWWALAQDERREIFEAQSRHIGIGMDYLPAIARRLIHCRDLDQPFDFLTWFEYEAKDAPAFDDLVAALRETEEWRYVEREVDIRLSRCR